MRAGLIRPATDADIDTWFAAVAAKAGQSDNPPIAGQHKPTPSRSVMLTHRPSYVVLRAFTYPAGLYGAHSVSFFIPRGVPRPQGQPGHSSVYDFSTLQCRMGAMLCPEK